MIESRNDNKCESKDTSTKPRILVVTRPFATRSIVQKCFLLPKAKWKIIEPEREDKS